MAKYIVNMINTEVGGLMKIPFLVWLFQGIPECIAASAVIFSLIFEKLPWGLVLKVGIIQAFMIYIIRLFPLTPGVHTIIYITVIGFLVAALGRITLKRAIITSAITVSTAIIIELIFRYTMFIFGVTPELINNNIFLYIITGYPQVIALFIIAYAINVKGQKIREMLKKVTKTEFYY